MDYELLKAIRVVVREELQSKANGELLDAEGLALALKVPVSWVYENSRTGKIPTVRVGKYVRFRIDQVPNSQKGGTNGND